MRVTVTMASLLGKCPLTPAFNGEYEHLQPRSCSVGPDTLAFDVLSVFVQNLSDANFVISQHNQNHFQSFKDGILFRTRFSNRNSKFAQMLIEVLFISLTDSCTGLLGKWLITHVAYPPSSCVHIH